MVLIQKNILIKRFIKIGQILVRSNKKALK